MSEQILKVDNLTISYEVKFYKARTVRDIFVDIITSPIDYFVHSPDRVVVLKDISFTVYKGDILGIIGKNGQGKTNLLESIYLSTNGDSFRFYEKNSLINQNYDSWH